MEKAPARIERAPRRAMELRVVGVGFAGNIEENGGGEA
jgi:hypothetical protein